MCAHVWAWVWACEHGWTSFYLCTPRHATLHPQGSELAGVESNQDKNYSFCGSNKYLSFSCDRKNYRKHLQHCWFFFFCWPHSTIFSTLLCRLPHHIRFSRRNENHSDVSPMSIGSYHSPRPWNKCTWFVCVKNEENTVQRKKNRKNCRLDVTIIQSVLPVLPAFHVDCR